MHIAWERPPYDLNQLLDSQKCVALSYCRGRETPATRLDGKKAGKLYPGKTGGGAAIIYNRNRFEAQTVRARELAFLENVHPPPRVTFHVSHVIFFFTKRLS